MGYRRGRDIFLGVFDEKVEGSLLLLHRTGF